MRPEGCNNNNNNNVKYFFYYILTLDMLKCASQYWAGKEIFQIKQKLTISSGRGQFAFNKVKWDRIRLFLTLTTSLIDYFKNWYHKEKIDADH